MLQDRYTQLACSYSEEISDAESDEKSESESEPDEPHHKHRKAIIKNEPATIENVIGFNNRKT